MGANDKPSPVHQPKWICLDCGHQGRAGLYSRGSMVLEILFWLFGIAAALFFFPFALIIPICYSLWRLFSKYKACRKCKGHLIKTDSPRGQKLAAELN